MMFPNTKILNVNLNTGEIQTSVIDSDVYRLYPGG